MWLSQTNSIFNSYFVLLEPPHNNLKVRHIDFKLLIFLSQSACFLRLLRQLCFGWLKVSFYLLQVKYIIFGFEKFDFEELNLFIFLFDLGVRRGLMSLNSSQFQLGCFFLKNLYLSVFLGYVVIQTRYHFLKVWNELLLSFFDYLVL